MNVAEIQDIKQRVLKGATLSRETVIALLSIDPDSEECEALGSAAFEVAKKVSEGKAYLWGAIGIDYKACSMNCDFCSLGEKWGLVAAEKSFSLEDIIEQVRGYAESGVRWIVLRTTQFYDLQQLGNWIREIRKQVPGVYEIGVNAGEFDLETANQMHANGIQFVYHSLRLREGHDTQFDPQVRMATLGAAQQSPLSIVFLVEPIGVEHSNEEIADICQLTIEYGAIVSGAMARIPVEGTPLGVHPKISEKRLAQIIAVCRLACGFKVKDICVHPASEIAVRFGANVAVIETGSIPRDNCCFPNEKWGDFDTAKAKRWFEQAGFTVQNHDK